MGNAAKEMDMMGYENFFSANLKDVDAEVFSAMESELARQQDQIELIASAGFNLAACNAGIDPDMIPTKKEIVTPLTTL